MLAPIVSRGNPSNFETPHSRIIASKWQRLMSIPVPNSVSVPAQFCKNAPQPPPPITLGFCRHCQPCSRCNVPFTHRQQDSKTLTWHSASFFFFFTSFAVLLRMCCDSTRWICAYNDCKKPLIAYISATKVEKCAFSTPSNLRLTTRQAPNRPTYSHDHARGYSSQPVCFAWDIYF